ncbi:MAG TPA: hypothetical protein VMU39_08025 [Solirubrobacteraceae bacterium]|nr:hypothetical protein [Solirubrobacteraceae bacterium]
MDSLISRWRDGAAVRAEHELDPTRRRRFDRLPQHFKDRRALRAERRLRAKRDIGDAARMAESTTFIRR